jgi:hypothetical protein
LPVRSRWAVIRPIAWTAISVAVVTAVPGWGASLPPPPPQPQPSQLYTAPPSYTTAAPTTTSTFITTTEQTPDDTSSVTYPKVRNLVPLSEQDLNGVKKSKKDVIKKFLDSADQKTDQSKLRIQDVNGKKRREIDNNKQHAQDTHDKMRQNMDRSRPKDTQTPLLY